MDTYSPQSFAPATFSDWQKQVRRELKDERADEGLRWLTPDGFTMEPYYTADALTTLPLTAIQGAQRTQPGWLNAPERVVKDGGEASTGLRQLLDSGADSLVLSLPDAVDPVSVSRIISGIKLSETPVFFRTGKPDELVKMLLNVAPYQWRGGLLSDPIAAYVYTGKAADTLQTTYAEATRLSGGSPRFRTICASSHVFHNAGATASQELAFLLGNLSDQYDALTDAGLSITELLDRTILSVSVGTGYFLEIAKLRALRVLWFRLAGCYDLKSVPAPYIHAQTSTFYDAKATPNTNLLRSTTEAMAAVIGGADVLTVHPFDAVLTTPSAFSERIARNVSVLLKAESYLDKVADPSAGSYYIETLTNELTESAWTLFLELEKQGGLLAGLSSGWVGEQIERSWQAKVDAVRQGRVLVGVTKFRFDEPSAGQDAVVPAAQTGLLPDRRLAAEFE
ncbi:methylmalonyl-CoA mutase family protein [Spirosoma rhododendri]|uniref:Methylmalonyl-CoA mutase n=1 Tax=Spirosoma rhododendri TaxID=2728024 RepID=A0A7L5DNX6_9BACT|nr:methylmalonyl-CoA mutase family protein [Spirosoma rhododendri]QJD77450.1 methylmalonyl-CoA mutase [Spirosoma rhododendri]